MTDQPSEQSGAPRVPRPDEAPPPSNAGPAADDDHRRPAPAMTFRGAPVTATLIIVMIVIEAALLANIALWPCSYSDFRGCVYDQYAFGVLYLQQGWTPTGLWTAVTSAFLHAPMGPFGGGLLHLGFNMAALAIFGPPVERSLRSPVYLAAYLLCAVAGCYFVYAWTLGVELFGLGPGRGTVLVGASGAISGLIAFEFYRRYLILSRMPRRLRPEAPATHLLRLSALFLGVNLAIILLPGQISGEAHIGGYLAGIALAPLAMRRISD